MDLLGAMRTFRQVVAAGGFAAAARQLGRATSSVSRQVAELERELGVRLVNRTTRSVGLTETGRLFHDRAVRILDDTEEARLAVAHGDGRPSGVLRVTLPTGVGREVVARVLPAFLARHDGVRVVLTVTDAVVDLVEAGIDVAVRLGPQKDSSLVARRIGTSRRVVCASPAYLRQAGTPARPGDLRDHRCLTWSDHPGRSIWSFRGPGGTEDVAVTGPLFTRSADTLVDAAQAGLGLVLLPDWNTGIELRAGRLRAVLGDYAAVPSESAVYAVYPPSPFVPPKVRAFVDLLTEQLRPGAAGAAAP